MLQCLLRPHCRRDRGWVQSARAALAAAEAAGWQGAECSRALYDNGPLDPKAGWPLWAAAAFGGLALRCCNEFKKYRPSLSAHVIPALLGILEKRDAAGPEAARAAVAAATPVPAAAAARPAAAPQATAAPAAVAAPTPAAAAAPSCAQEAARFARCMAEGDPTAVQAVRRDPNGAIRELLLALTDREAAEHALEALQQLATMGGPHMRARIAASTAAVQALAHLVGGAHPSWSTSGGEGPVGCCRA